jgi:hypothetical protein
LQVAPATNNLRTLLSFVVRAQEYPKKMALSAFAHNAIEFILFSRTTWGL